MWRRSGLLGIAVSLILLVALMVPAFAAEPIPHSFYGTVTIGGSPAAAGTEITAVVEGGGGSYTTTVEGQYGNPPFDFLVVAGEIEGGALIEFYVDGVPADQTATFHQGRLSELNLTVPAEDTTPPEVDSTVPVDDATGVAVDTLVTATFSEDIQEGANFTGIAISGATGVSATIDGATLTIAHDDFAEDTTYEVTIPAGAVNDLADIPNPLALPYTWSFTTGIRVPELEVVSTLPMDGATGVALGAVVSATFSEDIQAGATFGDIDIGGATGVSASITDDTLTIAHNDFAEDTTYVVTIPAGAVEDMTGNPLADDYTWSFTTGIPGTIDLVVGVNIIAYTGATTSLPGALTNIGPDGENVVDGLWARGAWTGGAWWSYNARIDYGDFDQLEEGRAYIIVVTEDCTWELPQ